MKKYTIYKWNINKNIIQTTVWFSASRKKNLISHHKVKNYDFKTSKKRNNEILLREQ